jgi:hypothetical protein
MADEQEGIPLADDEPVELAAADRTGDSHKIKRIGAAADTSRKSDFKRPLNFDGHGATRVRLFCSKISTSSLLAMERQINEWLDGEQIEVKHVAQAIGTMQDKVKEENLIFYVWY